MLTELPAFDSFGDLFTYAVFVGIVLLTIAAVKRAINDVKKGEGPSQAAVLRDSMEKLNVSVTALVGAEERNSRLLKEQNDYFHKNLEVMQQMDRVIGAMAMHLASIANDARHASDTAQAIRDSLSRIEGKL